MIVYVVTTPSSRGRTIRAAFEDRDQAIYFCAFLDDDDATLETVDTDAIKVSGNQKPLADWLVVIDPDGEVVDTEMRYTFIETRRCRQDMDGSYYVRITHPIDVSEEQAKEIALDYWRNVKK